MTGKIMPLRERDTSTIQAAADAFLPSSRYANPNTRRGYTSVLDRLLAGLGASRPLAEVSREELACGVPELGHCGDLGFLRGPFIFVEEAAEDGSALDPHLGEVSDRVIGYGRVELAAAMGSSAVVMGLVLG